MVLDVLHCESVSSGDDERVVSSDVPERHAAYSNK